MGPRRRRGWYPESCAGPGRNLSGPECFQHDLPAAAVVTRFDRLRTDLAARITSEWKSPDELYLFCRRKRQTKPLVARADHFTEFCPSTREP